ncbi:MAG: exosortase-associated EpsI family protein [Gemmataceae bacterium]
MLRTLPIMLTVAGMVAVGAWQVSVAIQRSDTTAYDRVQDKLREVPLLVGPWTASNETYDARQLAQANAKAHLYRYYTHRETGIKLQLLIVAGEAGDIGAHDPERCYGGAGFQQIGSRMRHEVTDPLSPDPGTYWATRFDTATFPVVSSQVAWFWTVTGKPVAAEDARREFLGRSLLFKVYVTRPITETTVPTPDTIQDLIGALLPSLRQLAE